MILSQICAAYYFAHFLIILPIVSRMERPQPLPNSITEAVLAKQGWHFSRLIPRSAVARFRPNKGHLRTMDRAIAILIGAGFVFVLCRWALLWSIEGLVTEPPAKTAVEEFHKHPKEVAFASNGLLRHL